MAKRSKVTFGTAFRKKTDKGKFKRGTLVCYKYVNGRRISTVKSKRK